MRKAGDIAIEMIFLELQLAEEKHPGWPNDKIHAVAILCEETGEAMQQAIDYEYKFTEQSGKEIMFALKTELAQSGAMAIRALINLLKEEGYE